MYPNCIRNSKKITTFSIKPLNVCSLDNYNNAFSFIISLLLVTEQNWGRCCVDFVEDTNIIIIIINSFYSPQLDICCAGMCEVTGVQTPPLSPDSRQAYEVL